jgi:plasmid maintenance system killer protein
LNSKTTERFRKAFDNLPENIKKSAKKNYSLWRNDPFHNSLKFKRISQTKDIYSIRIGKGWRALGLKKDEYMIWFWIGSHSEYDRLIKDL